MYDELTRGDVQKMQEEIDYRTQVLRPKLIEDVQTARAFGDLSENFEYKCAKQEKNRNDSRHPLPAADDQDRPHHRRPLRSGHGGPLRHRGDLHGKHRQEPEDPAGHHPTAGCTEGPHQQGVPSGEGRAGPRVGDRVQVDMGGGRSYWITIRSIEKGTDDGSIPIGSF